jgi:hypothetical protein
MKSATLGAKGLEPRLSRVELDSAMTPRARAARQREAEPLILDGYLALKNFPDAPPAEWKAKLDGAPATPGQCSIRISPARLRLPV